MCDWCVLGDITGIIFLNFALECESFLFSVSMKGTFSKNWRMYLESKPKF